ncbi:MAG: glutamate-1-semialdehyde 2,1-aminomutase [Gracilibacteraceae bacterium]|jgi:glutamate-1-semialdehyde 2,1-aminomutase|nr:glutamate-1-semialdehyde 2,1-aminomutase [Gracilibacteraceae bacterium]
MSAANTGVSEELFARACGVIPGGVNSPVRAFASVGLTPRFITRGEGCLVWDEDGNEYIDYVCSWGPLILGHRHSGVEGALREALLKGTTFGASTRGEVEMAEKIAAALPSVEMVRLVNSGTEATMSALRLARAFTERNKIIKFAGCYHGHHDSLLIKAGSGALTFGVPSSPGVPEDLAKNTLTAVYNDLAGLEALMAQEGPEAGFETGFETGSEVGSGAGGSVGSQVAAVIVEPVAGNMGLVLPEPGFLEGVRRLCDDYGALLIFDEVISGFRLGYGGAQSAYGVMPDLTCLGKIIGGGLPVGAYGGKREIMEMISPQGPVYQAGTLSGNPLAVAAGLAMLEALRAEGFYEALAEKTAVLADGWRQGAQAAGVPVCINQIGSLMTCFFLPADATINEGGGVRDFLTASSADTERYARFFRRMLDQGVYLPPSQFEALFVSAAHDEAVLQRTVDAAYEAFRGL